MEDDDLREVVQTIPEECSFTMIADCSHSGAIVEGANEIFGHSTNKSIDNSIRAPHNECLWKLNNPSSRDLGTVITACQNDQVTSNCFVDGKPKSFFLHTLMLTLDRYGTHISNRSLVERLRSYMAEEKTFNKGLSGDTEKQKGQNCNGVEGKIYTQVSFGLCYQRPPKDNLKCVLVFYIQRYRYSEAYQVHIELEKVEQDCISKGSISQELLPRLEKTIQRRSNFVVMQVRSSEDL
ncbi:RING-type E3 ubiquitin transferase [Trifolium repens]|nr:RING-type E3 ubiquitin transferase [Trifolium repens]